MAATKHTQSLHYDHVLQLVALPDNSVRFFLLLSDLHV